MLQNTEDRKKLLLQAETGYIENPHNHKALMENQGVCAGDVLRQDVFNEKMFRITRNGYKMRAKFRRNKKMLVETIQTKKAETELCLQYWDSSFTHSHLTLREVQREYSLKKQKNSQRHSFLLKAAKKRELFARKMLAWNKREVNSYRANKLKSSFKNKNIRLSYFPKLTSNNIEKVKTQAIPKPEKTNNLFSKIAENQAKALTIRNKIAMLTDSIQKNEADILQIIKEIKWDICVASHQAQDNLWANARSLSFVLATYLEGNLSDLTRKVDSLAKEYAKITQQFKKNQLLYSTHSQSLYQLHLNNLGIFKQAKLFSNEYEISEGNGAELALAREDLNVWMLENKQYIDFFEMLQPYFNHLKSQNLSDLKNVITAETRIESRLNHGLLRSWGRSYKSMLKHTKSWLKTSNLSRKWIRACQKVKLKKKKRAK